MTGKQSAVMWLGILLIVVRLFTTSQWPNLKTGFQTVTPGGGGEVQAGSGFSLPGTAATVFSDAANLANAGVHALKGAPVTQKGRKPLPPLGH